MLDQLNPTTTESPANAKPQANWHIQRLMLGGEVDRLHCAPMRAQTVAAHSWGVAMIIQRVWQDCRKELILAALQHDLGEQEVGDMPAPAKWRAPEAYEAFAKAETAACDDMGFVGYEAQLSEFERLVLKTADGLELLALAQNRLNNGELGAKIVRDNIKRHLDNKTFHHDDESEYDVIQNLLTLKAEILFWNFYFEPVQMNEPKS